MINSSSQKIFNNSILYAIGTVASKAAAFILIPIYTYNLTSEEYGIATTITTFVSTFGIVMMLSLRAAIIRFFNEYQAGQRQIFIGTITITVIVNSILLSALLIVFHDLYTDIFFKDISFYPYVLLGIISLGTEGIYLTYQSVLQAEQSGGRYSLNSFIYFLLNASLTIVFVVIMDLSVLGVVLANLFTNGLFAIYGLVEMVAKRYLIFKFDVRIFKKCIKYSLPILPHNLANDMNVYANKIIINNYLNYALTGIYSLASQFASMVNLIQGSINLAFRPWFIEQMKNGEEGRHQIKYMTEMIMALFCFIAVSVSVFSREIVVLFASNEYYSAWSIIPLFVFVHLITFIYYSHVQTLMYNVKISKFTSICSISGFFTNVIISLILVKSFGVYGIAIAQLCSKIVLSLIAVIMSNRAEKVDFGLKKMILYLFFAAAIIGVSIFFTHIIGRGLSVFVSLLLRFLLLAITFMVYIGGYIGDYKQLILGLVKKGNHNG